MVISHDIASAFKVADRLAVLYDGHLAAEGTPAEVRESKHPVRAALPLALVREAVSPEDAVRVKPAVNRALAVGVLAAVTGVAFLVALTFFRKGGYSERDSYLVYAYFSDATGLTWKSRVQIAGIQIGEVDEIALEARGRASTSG